MKFVNTDSKKSVVTGMLSTGIIFSGLCGMVSDNRASAHFVDKDYENMRDIIKRAPEDNVQEILEFVDVIKKRLNQLIKDHPRTDLCSDIVGRFVVKMLYSLGFEKSCSDFINEKEKIYNKYEQMTNLVLQDITPSRNTKYMILAHALALILCPFNDFKFLSSSCAESLIRLFKISDFCERAQLFDCLLQLIDAEYNVRIAEWERDNPKLELKHWSDPK